MIDSVSYDTYKRGNGHIDIEDIEDELEPETEAEAENEPEP